MNKETQEGIKNILISLSNNKCLGCKKIFDCDNKKADCKEYEKIKPFKHCYTCVYSTIADRLGNCYCDIRHKDYYQTSLLADNCKHFKRAPDEKKLCTERCESFYSKKYCTGKDKEPCKFLGKTVGGFDDFGDEKATELCETLYKEERAAIRREYKMVEKKTKRRQLVLQPSLDAWVEEEAKKKGLSVNGYIHKVLEEKFFAKEEKKIKE